MRGQSMIELPKMRFAPDLLQGKVALVTGGGTGMGHLTAIELARCGTTVAVLGRRLEPLHLAHDARQMIDAVKYTRRGRGDGKSR